MTDLSEHAGQPRLPVEEVAEPAGDLDEAVFDSVMTGDHLQPLRSAVTKLLDVMARDLMEGDIAGIGEPKKPKEFIASYRDARQGELFRELVQKLSAWAEELDAGGQVHLLVHLWWECFGLWDESLAYRTIEAVADAVDYVVRKTDAGAGARTHAWQRDTWLAVGAALRVMYLDGRVFKETNLSCAERVYRDAGDGIIRLNVIRDELHAAWGKLGGHSEAWDQVRPCVSYMRKYADQTAAFYRAMQAMAHALMEFERWLASARPPGARARALWPLSWEGARLARSKVESSLEELEEIKAQLSSHTLSEIEPWEQMLIGLRDDVLSPSQDGDDAPSVLIPRQVWVRYCYPFAVEHFDAEHAQSLLRSYAADDDEPRAQTSEHRLTSELRRILKDALQELPGKPQITVHEPEDLAQTLFFQTGERGHFGGIRIRLPDLVFTPDFIDGPAVRPYRTWLDLNRMGNFCLCVEAAQPLEKIPPPRLYRALRAGTPFVFGEPVSLAAPEAGQEGSSPLAWDNLYTYAQFMIKAAADAYGAAVRRPGDYIQGNLHEIVVVQTDAPIDVQSQEIARRLDSAVGGRILLRSVQRAAATLEEWTRFPPLQLHQASAVLAVPEIGYAGDWFVHTGETTVFGIVAVPAWFRDVYPEAAQFACSWSPVLQLWNRRLQAAVDKAIKDLDRRHDSDDGDDNASNELRHVEQQVRQHLAKVNADELCATLAYRRFLDSVLDAVGISRLERELQAQLQAAEQLADYSYQQTEKAYQKEEKKTTKRRDVLLLVIALLGVFSAADFLALLDTTNYHAQVGFIRLPQDGRWQDVVVLVLFCVALISGAWVLFGPTIVASIRKAKRKGSTS